MYDFVSGIARQAAASSILGSRVPKKVKRRVEIWTSEKLRKFMSRTMAAESEQLLGVLGARLLLIRNSIITHKVSAGQR